MQSSQTRDHTRIPRVGKGILIHQGSLLKKVISNILSSGFSWDTQEIFLAVLNSLKETILIHFVLETSAHQLKKKMHLIVLEKFGTDFPLGPFVSGQVRLG